MNTFTDSEAPTQPYIRLPSEVSYQTKPTVKMCTDELEGLLSQCEDKGFLEAVDEGW